MKTMNFLEQKALNNFRNLFFFVTVSWNTKIITGLYYGGFILFF